MWRDKNRQRKKKKLATAASVDRVYLWWHETIKHELLTATRTAEVVYRTLCKSWMYGELCRDNEKITAVFTQHTTHHLRRPVLSKKVHCNTLKTPRLLLNKYGSHRHE